MPNRLPNNASHATRYNYYYYYYCTVRGHFLRLPFFFVGRHGLAVFVPRHGRFRMSFGRIAFQDGRVTGRRVHVLGLHPKVLFQICNNTITAGYIER